MRSYLALLAALLPCVLADTYSASDTFVGTDFLTGFDFEAIADPTNGRVNYVDQATALAQNLTYANGDTLILRADDWSYLSSTGPGRNSVRIRSNSAYTTHVVVLDARHMPQGCGTWPAFWETTESDWPNGGEVDIVEGVNDQGVDQITLHTAPGCTMPSGASPMTGSQGNLDCEGNNGCDIQATASTVSYGPSFNGNDGGFYAMERNDDFIKVWFWPRNSDVPSDVLNGASTVNTDAWGTPVAYFPNTDCNIAQFFSANNIIINLTFCGDWAGSVYQYSGCPSDCNDYVDNNPTAFTNAFWDIGGVRVYENPTPSAGTYQIHPNGDTSKCLDVQGGVFADGTPVQIYDCNGTGAQNWLISSGTTAVQVAGTNFCLDAGSATPAEGTQMKIWDCYPGLAAQTWYYSSDNRISLQNSGQCLDDTNGSTNDGTILQTWECTDNDNYQVWTLS